MLVDDNAESSNTLDVENVAERVISRWTLCILQMQKIEWMSLDDINYDNIEDVPAVNDPEVRTPLFDPTTENVDDVSDS